MMKPRHEKFLAALARNGNKVEPAALEAGYSATYARKRGKLLYQTAMKAQAKELVKLIDNKAITTKEVKRRMVDIVGLTPDTIMERLRNIAMQEKDYGSALKVLGVLARELGVEMDTDAPKVTIPVLNVSMKPAIEPSEQLRTIGIVRGIDEQVE